MMGFSLRYASTQCVDVSAHSIHVRGRACRPYLRVSKACMHFMPAFQSFGERILRTCTHACA